MEDIRADLARLQQYATGLAGLMGELERAAPDRAEGIDQSGMVQVRLGHDGMPDAFAVKSEWSDELAAESFGGAVMEACQEAMLRRGREWARALARKGWQDRLERLGSETDQSVTAGATPVPDAFRRPAPGHPPLPMDVLAEQVMRRLDDLTSPVTTESLEPPHGTGGAGPLGTLVLTLATGGRVTCQADPGWVASQTGAELAEALNAALTAARRNLAAAARARTRVAGPPREFMTDVLAAFDKSVRTAKVNGATHGTTTPG